MSHYLIYVMPSQQILSSEVAVCQLDNDLRHSYTVMEPYYQQQAGRENRIRHGLSNVADIVEDREQNPEELLHRQKTINLNSWSLNLHGFSQIKQDNKLKTLHFKDV